MAWNRSSEAPKVAPKKSPSKMRGIVAGLVTVCALGGLCLWMFSGGEDAPKAKPDKERGRIKAVTPAVAQTNRVEEKKLTPQQREQERIRKILEAHGWTNGVYHSPHDPAYAEKHKAFLERQKRERPFDFDCENDISVLTSSKPGGFIFPMDFNEAFVEDFKRSLVQPIVISEDDSEELKEMKRAVREAKIYLKERMDAGEDICAILEASRKEINRISEIHDDFRKGMFDLYAKNASEEDIDDYITAANRLLDERGGPNIFLPPHFRKRFAKADNNTTGGTDSK